ncbi:MAG: hypothetical protein J7K00_03890 [Candidatus Diapherotrites archaeon]|nr:hypothetical protein [Candidatus Diapherotrites archaeon]
MAFKFFNRFFGSKQPKEVLHISKDKKYFTDDPSFKKLIPKVFDLDEAGRRQITVLLGSLVNFFEDPQHKTKVSFRGLGQVAYYFRGGEDDVIRVLFFKLSQDELAKGKTAGDILSAVYNPKDNKQVHQAIISKGRVSKQGVLEEFQVENPLQYEPVFKSLFAFEDLFFEICASSLSLRERAKKELLGFKKEFESKNSGRKSRPVAGQKNKGKEKKPAAEQKNKEGAEKPAKK